jgi:phage tail tube protein FII
MSKMSELLIKHKIETDIILEGSYKEALFKFDKFMPDDEELQRDFHDAVDKKDTDAVEMILFNDGDFDIMKKYLPKNATLSAFAKWIVDNDKGR